MPSQSSLHQVEVDQIVSMVNVANRPVVLVLPTGLNADHLPADGFTHKLGGIVAKRLPAFRAVDAVESDSDRFVLSIQDVDCIAVDDANDLADEIPGLRLCGLLWLEWFSRNGNNDREPCLRHPNRASSSAPVR